MVTILEVLIGGIFAVVLSPFIFCILTVALTYVYFIVAYILMMIQLFFQFIGDIIKRVIK